MALPVINRRKGVKSLDKLRAAVEQPVQSVIESLENRLHLSVSTDANGWTVVNPSPDSRLIYVSSSTGSDANSGLSPSSPVASINKATSLLRNGFPDWLLFMRGDTFNGSFSFGDSGRSAQEPAVITYYGNPSAPRPVIDAGANTAFRTGNGNHDFDIIGLNFTSTTHDPTSPNFNGQGSYGFYDLGNTSDILIEDCQFSYFINDITFQGYYGSLSNITIRRNEILDSYATSGHSEGLYSEAVDHLTITDNVFDHDGWNSDVGGAQPTIYNHDCYLHSSNSNCVVTGNTFADAASFGLQARAGGIVDNNLFINDPYGFSFGLVNGATTKAGGVSGEAIGNVVMEPRQDPSGWGSGAWIGNLAPGGGTVISNNVFSGAPGASGAAITFQPGNGVVNPEQEVGLNTVVISNNNIYNWGFGVMMSGQYVPGSTGADGLSGVVVRDNTFQLNATGRIVSHGDLYDPRFEDWSNNTYSSTTAPSSIWFSLQGTNISFATWQADVEPTAVAATVPFISPDRTIESYMSSQGLAASEAAFIAGARSQSHGNWNPLYFASTVNSYVQAGYIVDTSAPVAAAFPPADITPANYQTNPTPTFTINYTDQVAVNAATVPSASITITGPNGVNLTASYVTSSGSGPSISATYRIATPAGGWASVPNGTYVIKIAGGQVKDTSGNAITAQPIGSFKVSVASGTTSVGLPSTPTGLAAAASKTSITVTWKDTANDQTSFTLQRAYDANFTQGVVNLPMTRDTTSYVDSAVTTGTSYYYRISATNGVGTSAATAPVLGTLPLPAPSLAKVIIDDGNPNRTSVTSITLYFTEPVNVNPSMVSLVQNPSTTVPTILSNPTGDGKTWVISFNTGNFNNALTDGSYKLTVHGGMITDPYGQTAGGDSVTNFSASAPPSVTKAFFNDTTAPNSIALTFNQNVSASLGIGDLTLVNSSGSSVPAASFSWNASTLTGTWTYSGALPQSDYTATLSSTGVFNTAGVHLDGNGDGVPGNNFVYNFSQGGPSVTASGNPKASVGVPYTLNLGPIDDPGQATPDYLVHWGDGSTDTYSVAGNVTHTYLSTLGSTKITVDVIDGNGTHASLATVPVSVGPSTISAVLNGNSNANPGAVYTLGVTSFSDPGFTVSKLIVHWGDGATSTITNGALATHSFANATGAPINDSITVDLVDNSGTRAGAGALGITINPTPTVPVIGALNTNAGGTYRLLLGSPVDPGFNVSQLTINWGDGTAPSIVAPGTAIATHTFTSITAPNSRNVVVSLTDNSGTYTDVGDVAVIVNSGPSDSLTGNLKATVGGAYLLNVAPAVDPGQSVSAYTIHWGDGTANTVTSNPGIVSHVFNGTGNRTISVDVTDATGTFPSAGSLPIIVGTGPTLALAGNTNANVNGVYTFTLGTVTDPGHSVTKYTVHWGDGLTSTYTAGGNVAHTYTAAGPANITVDLTDSTGTYLAAGSYPISRSFPTLAISGAAEIFKGQDYPLHINPAADLGGTPSAYIINWGDGTSSTFSTNGQNNPIDTGHVYNVAMHAIVNATLVDSTGLFINAGSLSLQIDGPPTIAVSGAATTNAGAVYSLNLGPVKDPIGVPTSYIVHWGDNTTSTAFTTGPTTHVYSAGGNENITVDIVDQNGTYVSAGSTTVNVNQPTIQLGGNIVATINSPYTLTLGSVTDPGQSVSSFTVNWGDGQTSTLSSTGPIVHTYTSSGTKALSVAVTDSLGTFTAGGIAVAVNNNPSVAVTGNLNANVGGVYTLNVGPPADPNGTPSQYVIHWGDGASSTVSSTGAFTHTYTKTGKEVLSIDLTDSAGTWTSAGGFNLTVSPAPTVAVSGSGATHIGGTYTLNVGPATDTGYTVSKYTVHWGDGATSTYSTAGAVTHTYSSTGTKAVSVDLTDSTGTYTSAGSTSVAISAAPTVATSGAANATVGQSYMMQLGPVTDPGFTVKQYTVHWGDGTVSGYAVGGNISHTYTTKMTANITVDVMDNIGTFTNVGSKTITVGSPSVVGRYVFYNNSALNKNTTAPSTNDWAAIATDKTALLPGQKATFKNYTSYTKGINGIIVDIAGLPTTSKLSAKDFTFKVGNNSTTSKWTAGPTPTAVTIFRGAGTGGSDRVVITFADKAILNKWLQVTVAANANTGLTAASTFYFGNAPGDTGNSTTDAQVTTADYTATVSHESTAAAAVTNLYDFDRNGVVNSTDAADAKAAVTTTTTMLQLISV